MEKKPYFLVLGKIRRYKAYHHAIQALRLLRDSSEKCSLVIAGRQGEERYYAELKRLVKDHSLQDSVSIKLNVSEDEKAALLSNALALIVTSPIEGFSIVSVEANALGIPVIASDGVPDEVVTDGFNGIKYEFGDTNALARAMSKLLRDGALRQRMAANAIDSTTKFSWDKSAKLFKEVLQKTLSSRRITHREYW
jgi:glycosyltransferase involved in cell wall biosynthesis